MLHNYLRVSDQTGAVQYSDVRSLEDPNVDLSSVDWIATANFMCSGPDLILESPSGEKIVLIGYFEHSLPLSITGLGDMVIPAHIINILSGNRSPGQYAQAVQTNSVEPVGLAETIEGNVFVVRVDGTRVQLEQGDKVFQGDTVETGEDGIIGITFADESTLSLDQGGRMVIDEMVYDPGGEDSTASLFLLDGAMSFVSGQLAKVNPDAFSISTPVATIGIRGTSLLIASKMPHFPRGGIGAELPQTTVAIIPEVDDNGAQFVGEAVVRTKGGIQVISGGFEGTTISKPSEPPSPPQTVSLTEIGRVFGGAIQANPNKGRMPDGLERAVEKVLIQKKAEEKQFEAKEKAENAKEQAENTKAELKKKGAELDAAEAEAEALAQQAEGAQIPEEQQALEIAAAKAAQVAKAAAAKQAVLQQQAQEAEEILQAVEQEVQEADKQVQLAQQETQQAVGSYAVEVGNSEITSDTNLTGVNRLQSGQGRAGQSNEPDVSVETPELDKSNTKNGQDGGEEEQTTKPEGETVEVVEEPIVGTGEIGEAGQGNTGQLVPPEGGTSLPEGVRSQYQAPETISPLPTQDSSTSSGSSSQAEQGETNNDEERNDTVVENPTPLQNQSPIAGTLTASGIEDSVSVTFTLNDLNAHMSDPDGGTPAVTEVAGQSLTASWGPIAMSGGTLSFDGTETFTFAQASDFNGVVNISYTASDGSDVTAGNVAITISSVNDTPVLSAITETDLEDTGQSFTIAEILASATDVDGDTLSLQSIAGQAVTQGTAWGSSSASSNGSLAFDGTTFIYTPNADSHGAAESFSYVISDGTTTETNTLDINVTSVNDAPIISDPSVVISTNTSYGPTNSSIIELNNGKMVIAWNENRGTDNDVYFDILNTDGTFQGLQSSPVSQAASLDQVEPKMAVMSDGSFVLIYRGYAGGNSDAYARAFNADGSSNTSINGGNEFIVHSSTSGFQGNHNVHAMSDGSFIVTFQDNTDGEYDVHMVRYNSNGTKINDSYVSNDSSYAENGLSLQELSAGGDYVASYSRNGSIYFKIFNDDTTTRVSETLVNVGGTSQSSIAVLANGNIAIAYKNDTNSDSIKELFFKVYDSNGAQVIGEVAVQSVSSGLTKQSIVTLGNGNILLVWNSDSMGDDSDGCVVGRIYTQAGSAVTDEFFISRDYTGDAEKPVVTELAGGGFAVTWLDDSNQIVMNEFSATGQAVLSTDVVTQTNENEAVSGNLYANDIEGDSLVFSLSSGAANGVTVVNSDGSYTYTPDTNYLGTDSFVAQVSDGNGGTNTLSVTVTVSLCSDVDPLVIDLDGDGIELLSATNGVEFDVNVDGGKENVGWMNSDDGLLVMDIDEDGQINDMFEVISHYFAYQDRNAEIGLDSSLEVLALFDDNEDSVIDSEDDIFGLLSIWQDKNSDGLTDEGELLSLNEHGISSFNLNFNEININQDGNTISKQGFVQFDDAHKADWNEVSFSINDAGRTRNEAEIETQDSYSSILSHSVEHSLMSIEADI